MNNDELDTSRNCLLHFYVAFLAILLNIAVSCWSSIISRDMLWSQHFEVTVWQDSTVSIQSIKLKFLAGEYVHHIIVHICMIPTGFIKLFYCLLLSSHLLALKIKFVFFLPPLPFLRSTSALLTQFEMIGIIGHVALNHHLKIGRSGDYLM